MTTVRIKLLQKQKQMRPTPLKKHVYWDFQICDAKFYYFVCFLSISYIFRKFAEIVKNKSIKFFLSKPYDFLRSADEVTLR